MNKAYRFRIYPNSMQKTMFAKTLGVCNKMLVDKIEYYKAYKNILKDTPVQYN